MYFLRLYDRILARRCFKLKIIFGLSGIIGSLLIFVLVFNILNNSLDVIPSVISSGYDKPIWISLVIVFDFFIFKNICKTEY